MKKIFSVLCVLALVLNANALEFGVQKMKKFDARHSFSLKADMPELSAAKAHRAQKAVMDDQDLSDQIAEVTCEYYSNPAYSQPGAYDYYFEMYNLADGEMDFPYICFDLYLPTNTGLVAGTYSTTNGDLDGVMVMLEYYDYLYAMYNMPEYMSFIVAEAELTITEVSAGVYNLELIAADADGNTVTVVKNNVALDVEENEYDPSAEGDENDMQEDVTIDFATADIVSFEVDEEEGFAYVRLVKGDEMIALLIYVSGNTLPAGTYTIDDSYAEGSVQPGVIYDNSIYPSFYGTLDAEGYLVDIFLCVDGTVTVSYDANGELVLDIDATNTWGNSLHATLNGGAAAVDHVEAANAAAKAVRNGQLVIIRNGVEYNANGAKL